MEKAQKNNSEGDNSLRKQLEQYNPWESLRIKRTRQEKKRIINNNQTIIFTKEMSERRTSSQNPKKPLKWVNIQFFEKNNIHFKVQKSSNGDIITLMYCKKCYTYQHPDYHSEYECIFRKQLTPKKLDQI